MELGGIGQIYQIIGLLASSCAIALYGYSYAANARNIRIYGNIAFIIAGIGIFAASVTLVIALAISDFSIAYVASYTDISLPLFYKLSAFWGGQAGSLLLWAFLLVLFGAIEIFRLRKLDDKYQSAVMLTMAVITAFFIMLVSFLQNPFETVNVIPSNGRGLNPLLQNPGMVIHPPTLYIGYVGYAVIFSHAIGAILSRNFSADWIKLARSWSLIIWAFLTIGIVIGAWWAYVELGWGGYWAWDPVENASLMPWFTATAFLHSAYVYERKNSLRIWSFILIFITFELTILGTFITRSGIIESVHSFGPNAIGSYFLFFIAASSAIYLLILMMNPDFKTLAKNNEFSFLSREGLIFIANWLLIAITIAVIYGTLSPAITGAISENKQTIELSYYNAATRPFFFLIILLSGIGILTGFKAGGTREFFSKLALPAALAFAGTVILIILGYNILWSILLAFAAFFACFASIYKIAGALKSGGVKNLLQRNRFYAAMIVHFGLAVISFGIIMSSFYQYHNTFIAKPGDVFQYKNYSFEIDAYRTVQEKNYIAAYVPIKIYKNGVFLSTAYPEIREYNTHETQSFGEISYLSMITGDLYFALYSFHEDGSMRIPFIFQPFVSWIWAGCAIMAIGAIFGAFNFKRKDERDKTA